MHRGGFGRRFASRERGGAGNDAGRESLIEVDDWFERIGTRSVQSGVTTRSLSLITMQVIAHFTSRPFFNNRSNAAEDVAFLALPRQSPA